jgi:hypothetical protein
MSNKLNELSEELKNVENMIFDKIIEKNSNIMDLENEYEIIGDFKTTLKTKFSLDDEYKLKKNIEIRLTEYFKFNKRQMFYPKMDELKHYYVSRPYSNRVFTDEEKLFCLLTLGLTLIFVVPLYFKRCYKWYTSKEYYAIFYKINLRRSNVEVIYNQ